MTVKIIFATSVFEDIDTGPGIYARYLWQHFSADALIDFHVVAPEFGTKHSRLIASGKGKNSRDLYQRLQKKAWELAVRLGPNTIVHGNAAHSMSLFLDCPWRLIVQVNDYEPAELPRHALGVLFRVGYRRLLALAWRRYNEHRVLRRADLVLCNSDYTRRAVMRTYHTVAERCRTLKKAVDVSCFGRPEKLPADPLPGRPVGARLIFVGTNWECKGLDVLLHAIPKVAVGCPDISLVVVGPLDQGSNRRIAALADHLDIARKVHFMGRLSRTQLIPLFWHADVAVLPSRREALGVAVLEAMAAGLPVVAARTGGIPEIVDDGVCGFLCEPGDPGDLACKLNQLFGDPNKMRDFADAGRRKVEEFSSLKMVSELRRQYLDLAGQSVQNPVTPIFMSSV